MASNYEEIYYDRFLPASLQTSLVGLAARTCGAVLLLAVTAAWITLITWSSADPSFTHVTSHKIENALGAPGAAFADLFLQAFGLASVFVLLPPMFWGLELVTTQQVSSGRTKSVFYMLAVFLLAGAFSALPGFSAWHFQQGLGGAIGDIVYSLGASVGNLFLPLSGGAIAGFGFFAVGFAFVAHSLGLHVRDLWGTVSEKNAQAKEQWSWRWNTQQSVAPHLPLPGEPNDVAQNAANSGSTGARRVSAEWGPYDPGFTTEDPEYLDDIEEEDEPVLDAQPPPLSDKMVRGPSWDEDEFDDEETFGAAADAFDEDIIEPDEEFDRHTDDASLMMAQRFAPASRKSSKLGSVGRQIESSLSRVSFLGSAKPHKKSASFKLPSLNLLQKPVGAKPSADLSQAVLRQSAQALEQVLADFGVRGEVRDIRPGPVVTVFEFEPVRGTKATRIIGLADDIARSMSATSARVAVLPGRGVIGIELPNPRRETVMLRELLASDAFRNFGGTLPLALGKSISGEPVISDLAAMPHLLVAGTTGSGKSVGVNAMIASILYRHVPDDCRLLLIDPKMLELSVYNGIPHLLSPVVTDPEQAVNALNWVVCEMEERYKRMSKLAVRNIQIFNNRVRNAKKCGQTISRTVQTGFDEQTGEALFEEVQLDFNPMPHIVVVIDEFADLMMVAGKDVEFVVQRLAQKARAAGIHLIMATQRASVDVITGTIKANFPARIGYKVSSKVDSRTILGEAGAEQLLGHGDMLVSTNPGQVLRVHGPIITDDEIELIAGALREQSGSRYVEGVTSCVLGESGTKNPAQFDEADIYDAAVDIVVRDGKASTSYLQRRLSIGYNRAADLIERMEQEGLVSPPSGNGRRQVLVAG